VAITAGLEVVVIVIAELARRYTLIVAVAVET
jgi:hypothetical protein